MSWATWTRFDLLAQTINDVLEHHLIPIVIPAPHGLDNIFHAEDISRTTHQEV